MEIEQGKVLCAGGFIRGHGYVKILPHHGTAQEVTRLAPALVSLALSRFALCGS